jgi:hypothetical protein
MHFNTDSLQGDLQLWRYMDLARFISMLDNCAIWLARADTFRDKHEGRFPDAMRVWIEKAYEEFSDTDPSPVKDAEDFQDYLVKNTFISCWHKNNHENMVMWEIYGRDTNAIAIQTTVNRMANSIDSSGLSGHSLLLKPVIYERSENIPGRLLYEDCFFRKRPHFAFEEEVRISLDTYSRFNPSKTTPHGYALPVSVSALIASVWVHPDSSEWFLQVVNSITQRYELDIRAQRGSYGNK